jgi:hypothetical protein
MKFKAEDFEGIPLDHGAIKLLVQGVVTEIANARLAQILEQSPVVTGNPFYQYRPWSAAGEQKPDDTHCARLVDIQEIK